MNEVLAVYPFSTIMSGLVTEGKADSAASMTTGTTDARGNPP